jgi:hypothetical protein
MKFLTMPHEAARITLKFWMGALYSYQTNEEWAAKIPNAKEMVAAARDRMEELQPGSSHDITFLGRSAGDLLEAA